MPVFDFKCNKCNHIKEELLRIAEVDMPQNCPDCGDVMTKLIPSSISICQQGYSYNTSERSIAKKYS